MLLVIAGENLGEQNVDPTLKTKQNPASVFQRYTMLIQRRIPTLKQRRNNVAQR